MSTRSDPSSSSSPSSSPFDSEEWKEIERKYLHTRQVDNYYANTCMSIFKFVSRHYPVITFRQIEERMRQTNAIPYFFAEDPKISTYLKGGRLSKLGGKEMSYILCMSTKSLPREVIMLDFERGTWDTQENLRRLESASLVSTEGKKEDAPEVILKGMLRELSKQTHGVFTVGDKEMFAGLLRLKYSEDPEVKLIWSKIKIPIEWGGMFIMP